MPVFIVSNVNEMKNHAPFLKLLLHVSEGIWNRRWSHRETKWEPLAPKAEHNQLSFTCSYFWYIRLKKNFRCFILALTLSIISRTEMPYSSRCTAGAVQRGCNVAEAGVSIGCTVKGATIRLKKKMPQYNACNVTLICFINASQHHFVIKERIHTFNQTFAAVKQKGFKRFLADYKQSYWCCVVLCWEYKNPWLILKRPIKKKRK